MELSTYVRKPFIVEAVQITEENIADCAVHIGSLEEKPDGTPYIMVDKRLVPNVYRVFPGYWMTKMGENIRCYANQIFEEQFVKQTPQIANWVENINDQLDEVDA